MAIGIPRTLLARDENDAMFSSMKVGLKKNDRDELNAAIKKEIVSLLVPKNEVLR